MLHYPRCLGGEPSRQVKITAKPNYNELREANYN